MSDNRYYLAAQEQFDCSVIIKDSYALYTPQIVNWKQNEPNEIKTQTSKCQNIKNICDI